MPLRLLERKVSKREKRVFGSESQKAYAEFEAIEYTELIQYKTL